ncbi:efflux RND transporter periplasmic adaptor subunit [Actinoallomurus spadix]|uniref:Peptidoglycan binding-like domain-containing protein n=1 Tax=Actinoallomurus spadix TaxID=79912 RepID=A0ABP3H2S7_9ACTN|nr:efflux RND transporter periplasmic adaptor subunit [Actinoallomurus spadix]MCO5987850.1 efflux RND transporter periplasmic adaptor subunit [Actinoallomurus spadix]
MSAEIRDAVGEAEVPGSDTSGRTAPRRRRRRFARVGGAIVVLAVAAGIVIFTAGPFGDRKKAPGPTTGGESLASVRKGPLSSQVDQSGTLSYVARADGTPYSVVNHANGVYTWVPRAGDEVECGKVLYWVAGTPVPLLCGTWPAYRDLSEGDSGKDVRELNRNLVKLGYADDSDLDPDSKYFGSATATALEKLQDEIGAEETGSLKLGSAVFLPGPLRITKAAARLGTNARPGEQVAQATSTDRQVTVNLDASQQAQVKVGDKVEITLPDNRTTSGKVGRIGAVATSSSDQKDSSGSSGATIPVYVTLTHPKDAGRLDQAPVRVQITTGGVKDALIVPVTALIGQAGGGYSVEKVDARGARGVVPVTLGLFDNADGLVQVSGNLAPGDRVVVPAT